MFKHILVPTDGSELSMRAVRLALAMARESGGRVTFVHVMEEPPHAVSSLSEGSRYDPVRRRVFADEERRHSEVIAEAALEEARREGVAADFCLETSNHPYEAIIRAAAHHACDLICMASHGRRGVNALLIGSETNKVLTHCSTPILVCR